MKNENVELTRAQFRLAADLLKHYTTDVESKLIALYGTKPRNTSIHWNHGPWSPYGK